MSISALGSVNGSRKDEGVSWYLCRTFLWQRATTLVSESVNDTLVYKQRFTWWKKACASIADSLVTVYASRQMRMGGCEILHDTGLRWMYGAQVWYCVGIVFDEESILHVACRMVFGKVHGGNTCQSSSTSGPSAMLNPIRANISMISFFTMLERMAGSLISRDSRTVRSRSSQPLSRLSNCSFRAAIFSCALFLSSFRRMPTSFFWSAGTLRKSAISSLMALSCWGIWFGSASSSSALAAFSASTCRSLGFWRSYRCYYLFFHIKRCRYNFIIVLPSIAAYYFFINSDCQPECFSGLCVRLSIYNVPLRCSFNYSNIFPSVDILVLLTIYILYIIFELFFLILGRRASHVFLEYCIEVY